MLKVLRISVEVKLIEGLTTKELVQQLINSDRVPAILFHSVTEEQLDEIYQCYLENNLFKGNYSRSIKLISKYRNLVLGYNRTLGKIHVSYPLTAFFGKFIIDNEKIVYDPNASKLKEERDLDKYCTPAEHYTSQSIDEILASYIYDGRQCLVDNGYDYSVITYPLTKKTEEYSPDEFYNSYVKKINNGKPPYSS